MIEWILFWGAIWLLLVICAPAVTYFETARDCNKKYAWRREQDAKRLEELERGYSSCMEHIDPPKQKSKRQLKRERMRLREKERKALKAGK